MTAKNTMLALALALGALGASCSTNEERAAGTSAREEAARKAQPGTYEDWCDEHAVPESQCTRCNVALIPAFKATGDWCDEHGLPESQCKACNPNLRIERPAKRGSP